MEKEELDALIERMKARGEQDAIEQYEGQADDGLQIARAMLRVLGRKFGLSFVLEVQREVFENAANWAEDPDPCRRKDALDIVAVAEAGYFTDLIDELSDELPSGRA